MPLGVASAGLAGDGSGGAVSGTVELGEGGVRSRVLSGSAVAMGVVLARVSGIAWKRKEQRKER